MLFNGLFLLFCFYFDFSICSQQALQEEVRALKEKVASLAVPIQETPREVHGRIGEDKGAVLEVQQSEETDLEKEDNTQKKKARVEQDKSVELQENTTEMNEASALPQVMSAEMGDGDVPQEKGTEKTPVIQEDITGSQTEIVEAREPACEKGTSSQEKLPESQQEITAPPVASQPPVADTDEAAKLHTDKKPKLEHEKEIPTNTQEGDSGASPSDKDFHVRDGIPNTPQVESSGKTLEGDTQFSEPIASFEGTLQGAVEMSEPMESDTPPMEMDASQDVEAEKSLLPTEVEVHTAAKRGGRGMTRGRRGRVNLLFDRYYLSSSEKRNSFHILA